MTNAPGNAVRIPAYIVTALLWLASAVFSTATVYYTYALSILIYSILSGKQGTNEFFAGIFVGQVAAFISGLIWLGVILVTGEYHLKHAGTKKSWKVIAYVLGIQLLIIIVGMLATGAVPFSSI